MKATERERNESGRNCFDDPEVKSRSFLTRRKRDNATSAERKVNERK